MKYIKPADPEGYLVEVNGNTNNGGKLPLIRERLGFHPVMLRPRTPVSKWKYPRARRICR